MEKSKLNYFILTSSPEAIKEVIIYGEFAGGNHDNFDFKEMDSGDILLFYPLEPINGIVGFATVKNKVEIENSNAKIEFSRNYCLPMILWKEEKIDFNNYSVTNKGIKLLSDREEINRISQVINLKWGVELTSKIESESLEKPLFTKNNCLECGKELDNRLLKYCPECRIKVKKRQSLEWNKRNIEKVREAGKEWRRRNLEKVKEYNRRWKERHADKVKEQKKRRKELNPKKAKAYLKKWREKNKISKYLKKLKQPDLFLEARMSDWSKELRKHRPHLSWIVRNKKRSKKINEIENKFNCCWEDKFKEVYERYKHEEAAKILNLDYHTLFIWAKHLKLQRLCIYCNKKLATAEGTFHPECKIRYESTQQSLGIKELFSLTDPALNIGALNLKDENIRQVIEDVLSTFPRKESLIIENRYLFLNRKQTLEELGNILDVTRERIRQIEQKAIKKLSHPTRQKIIREKLSKLIFKDSAIADSSFTGKINKLQTELNQLKQKLTGGTSQGINDIPLTEIELSVRATNCLEGASIKTIGQLANRTESEMLSIRNFGKNTLWELREILHSFGLKFNNEPAISIYQKDKNKALMVKKKCLFIGCNVTPHKGKYCSKHKIQKRKSKIREKCLHGSCDIIPHKGKYCSKHKPHKKKIRDRRRCSFPSCKISPRKGEYCSKHISRKEGSVIKNKCLFPGCNIVPQKREYCSKHKTSWQRKRALELLETKKDTLDTVGSADKKHTKKYTVEELKEIHPRLHPRG